MLEHTEKSGEMLFYTLFEITVLRLQIAYGKKMRYSHL